MNLFIYFLQNYGYRRFEYQEPWYEQWFDTIINAPWISSTVLLIILFWIFKKRVRDFHSNWNTLLDNFSYSTEEFYKLLQKELYSHGIKDMTMVKKNLSTDSLGISKRKYLRIYWKDYEYYICAAPFGNNGFFISWHLIYDDPTMKLIISKIPFVGSWLADRLFHITFYKRDTASMFMTYTHQSVLKVIDEITNEKGVRTLIESERTPRITDFNKR